MNIKKLLLGAVVAFVAMFLLGYLWHAVLMVDFYADHPGEIGNAMRDNPKIFYVGLGYFVLALVMAYMYPKGAEGPNYVMDGLKFGAIIGFLWIVPVSSVMYGATTFLSKTSVFVDGIYHIVEGAIAGLIIALIYKEKAPAESTSTDDPVT